MPREAPTAASAAPCNTGCATGNGGSIWQRKASRTTAGASSRHRGCRAFYGDLGWKGTDAEIHLVTSAADNYFGVVGPTPVQLLANDYRAIYTWPQTTLNQAELIALNGRYAVTDHWTVQSNLYYRRCIRADRREPRGR